MNYLDKIIEYIPYNQQEEQDKRVMLSYIESFPHTILTRKNNYAHMTASSVILNKEKSKMLMIYHNIYKSWSWTGGHADGEDDFMQIAFREAREETGISSLTPIKNEIIALDILPVWGHIKNGAYVSSHLHLNLSFAFYANEKEAVRIKEDENSGVGWISLNQLEDYVSEPDMLPVYHKILKRII